MYTDTITLFNRVEGKTGDTWYPSVLRNVHLSVDRAAIMSKYGAASSDSAVLHVRYTQDGENKKVGEKLCLPPKEWKLQEDHTKALTFSTGDQFDFFWLGDWGNETPIHDSDYGADLDFYTYMNRKYDNVFAISSVGGPYSVIPHFEIMGK